MNILAEVSARKVMLGIGLLSIVVLGVLPAFLKTAHAADTTGSVTVAVVVKGGTANPSNFVIHIKKNGANIGNISGSGDTVTFSSLTPGSYLLSETGGPSNYGAVWSGNCNSAGMVTIAATAATCTVTNTYGVKPPSGGGSGTPGRERPPRR